MTSRARRRLLRRLALAIPVALLFTPRPRGASAAAPLLDAASPEAKAVRYVEDASKASGAAAGSSCASCALYQGGAGSKQGACQIFPGKEVMAAGWCSSWAPQL
jgi:High potential iron-sulfur protein